MLRGAIIIGAALIGGVVTFLFFRTYMGFGQTSALVCAAAVTFGLGVIAHLNTPDSDELEDSLE